MSLFTALPSVMFGLITLGVIAFAIWLIYAVIHAAVVEAPRQRTNPPGYPTKPTK